MNKLKEKYIEDLRSPVYYDGKVRPRFRWYDTFETFQESDHNNSRLNDCTDLWFISDHHFSHKNIITYSKRPFATVAEMNSFMIEQHNNTIGEDDVVIFVGDFSFANHNYTKKNIFSRMNGYKILILGNHDVHRNKFKDFGYDEVYVCKELVINDLKILVTHFPLLKVDNGELNIHGHLHVGHKEKTDLSTHFNVNCEFINYTPIHIDKILNQFNERLNTE